VLALTQAHNISGVPVVDADGQLVGIVTHRDMRFETELDDPVRHIMTKKDRLVTVKEGAASMKCSSCCTATASRKCWWSTTPSSCAA
jgi:CBS domain-containing protein